MHVDFTIESTVWVVHAAGLYPTRAFIYVNRSISIKSSMVEPRIRVRGTHGLLLKSRGSRIQCATELSFRINQ